MDVGQLPWRGTAAERPDLPVPPQPLPLRRAGCWRKRWRYVGAYDEAVMLCAAVVGVGPLGQAFWAVWDRGERRMLERTRALLPLRSAEVAIAGDRVRVRSGSVAIELELGACEAIESICPNGEGAYTWTRKRAGVPVEGTVTIQGGEHRLRARGVDDESAGYHPRRTSWYWSAGVGDLSDGRAVAWNLVSGINDPPRASERAIWVEGSPSEPDPVSFEGLEAIRLADGSRLSFEAEGARARRDSVPLVFRSDYEAPFGTFGGSLGDGLELREGLGVMERHDAVW